MAALFLGTLMFLRRKGTTSHKVFGYLYAGAMLIVTTTAFGIYHLTGRVGAFHFAAVVSFVTLLVALIPAITRRPRDSWLRLHYKYTGWSYVGLVAAALSEAAVRLPHTPFWGVVAIGSALVFGGGGFAISSLQQRTLAKLPSR
jgi:uncharacterized membrane protein